MNRSINYLALDLTKIPTFTGAFSKVADGHLSAVADVQRALKSVYSSNDFEGDLIGGMQSARKVATKSAALATSIDELLSMYGYPATNTTEIVRNIAGVPTKAYHVIRYSPGIVHYRYAPTQAWNKLPLTAYGDGSYRGLIPAASAGASMQYVFVRSPRIEGEASAPEASSIIMREGADPIVFHNKFPESSPVIADAYNHQTKGAHGMTLYFFSGVQMKKQSRGPRWSELAQQYMELAFAKIGAPSWTKFFGM